MEHIATPKTPTRSNQMFLFNSCCGFGKYRGGKRSNFWPALRPPNDNGSCPPMSEETWEGVTWDHNDERKTQQWNSEGTCNDLRQRTTAGIGGLQSWPCQRVRIITSCSPNTLGRARALWIAFSGTCFGLWRCDEIQFRLGWSALSPHTWDAQA